MKRALFVLILLGAVATAATYYARLTAATQAPRFRAETVRRGDLRSTIGATGTLQPEEVVDVGAQVMGSILEFGRDPRDTSKLIDYGSQVEKGTVLARIDPTLFEAAVAQAEAALERSRAELDQAEARLQVAELNWKRSQGLIARNSITPNEYETARGEYLVAKSNVALARASIRQSEAALSTAKTNLGYTTISSPVQGVIVDRRVNVGQTVVSSFNAPSLFLIAKDLRRIQVWASVNEADIGQIHLGMTASFSVDAFPDQVFRGKVSQIRLNASMNQNIVTYTVVVTTESPDGKLLPYLTANVQFEVDVRPGVLLVPNAALRWRPRAEQLDPTDTLAARLSAESSATPDHGVLWVQDGPIVRPVEVEVGTSDGTATEVRGPKVQEGLAVVVGEREAEEAEAGGEAGGNPFLPKMKKPPPGPSPL